MIGFRHTDTCLCGCHRVVGIAGEVFESYPSADLAYVRFMVPSHAGGELRAQDVAYTIAEAA